MLSCCSKAVSLYDLIDGKAFWRKLEIIVKLLRPHTLVSRPSQSHGILVFPILLHECDCHSHEHSISPLNTILLQVTMANQKRSAKLADVYRYFIFLGVELQKMSEELSGKYYSLCIVAFARRYNDICTPICYLALILDPGQRYVIKSGILVFDCGFNLDDETVQAYFSPESAELQMVSGARCCRALRGAAY